MSTIRNFTLGLVLLAVIAPFARGQQQSEPPQTPQIQLDVLLVRLSIPKDEVERIFKETRAKKKKLGQAGSWSWTTGKFETAMNPVRQIREQGNAKFLACPKIVTQVGRPAVFHSGGRILMTDSSGVPAQEIQQVKFEEIGLKLDFLPTLTTQGKVRLQMEFTQRELVQKQPNTFVAQTIKTTVEVRKGESLFILAPDSATVEAQKSDTPPARLLIMVTPTILKD